MLHLNRTNKRKSRATSLVIADEHRFKFHRDMIVAMGAIGHHRLPTLPIAVTGKTFFDQSHDLDELDLDQQRALRP